MRMNKFDLHKMKKTNMRRKLTIAFSSLWVLVANGQSMKENFD